MTALEIDLEYGRWWSRIAVLAGLGFVLARTACGDDRSGSLDAGSGDDAGRRGHRG